MRYWTRVCALGATAAIVPYASKSLSIPSQNNEVEAFQEKVEKANLAVKQYMLLNGAPGVSVGVSVNGKTLWKSGVGFSDVEQGVSCNGDTVMRIASISKSITSVMAALLVQEGKLDIDLPIQNYVPQFPKKKFADKDVEITCRQLMSHTSGIRHYKKAITLDTQAGINQNLNEKNSDNEFYLNREFKSAIDSLKIFQDDALQAEPGKEFVYTTFGYTLLSAAMEQASKQSFQRLLTQLTTKLGMTQTRLDTNLELVPKRTRYYRMTDKGKLENVPEVNNSYKWAGGGILSNVSDLLIFANTLLHSCQATSETIPKPLLNSETIQKMWTGEIKCEEQYPQKYGWGWCLVPGIESPVGPNRTSYYYHTGGAVGASSILLIRPGENKDKIPSGTCVAILVNMQHAGKGILPLALEISEIFSEDFQKQ